jgi:hypothetical protein
MRFFVVMMSGVSFPLKETLRRDFRVAWLKPAPQKPE